MKKYQFLYILIFLSVTAVVIYSMKGKFEFYPDKSSEEKYSEKVAGTQNSKSHQMTRVLSKKGASFDKAQSATEVNKIEDRLKNFTPEQVILFKQRMKRRGKQDQKNIYEDMSHWEFEKINVTNKKMKVAKNHFVVTKKVAQEKGLNIVNKINDKFVVVESDTRPSKGMWLVEKRENLVGILTGHIKVQLLDMGLLDNLNSTLGMQPYDQFDHLKIVFYKYESLDQMRKLESILLRTDLVTSFDIEVVENTRSNQ